MNNLIVIAKQPVPGRVKTRLTPALTPQQAADVAAAALRDTLAAVSQAPAAARVLAFDGDATDWTPAGWLSVPQASGGLDRRLAAAFRAVPHGPSVLVGMDTPQLHVDHFAGIDLVKHDACLGPAADGGYWAIGFADPSLARRAIHDVPMSSADTGAAQLARLHELGLQVQLLPELVDVDTIDTAHHVAALAPDSEFAAALAATRVAA